MSLKKSIRLTDGTVRVCLDLAVDGEANFAQAVNSVFQQFLMFVDENLPDLTPEQWEFFYKMYSNYAPHPNIAEEARLLHWNVCNLESKDVAIAEMVEAWTLGQKLAVIYKTKAYLARRGLR